MCYFLKQFLFWSVTSLSAFYSKRSLLQMIFIQKFILGVSEKISFWETTVRNKYRSEPSIVPLIFELKKNEN